MLGSSLSAIEDETFLVGAKFGEPDGEPLGDNRGAVWVLRDLSNGTQSISSQALAVFYGEDAGDNLGTSIEGDAEGFGTGSGQVMLIGAPNAGPRLSGESGPTEFGAGRVRVSAPACSVV